MANLTIDDLSAAANWRPAAGEVVVDEWGRVGAILHTCRTSLPLAYVLWRDREPGAGPELAVLSELSPEEGL